MATKGPANESSPPTTLSGSRAVRPATLATRRAGLSSQGGAVALKGNRDAWTWCASPTELLCRDGQIVPHLKKAWHSPGLHGNGRAIGNGDGMIAALMRDGAVEIPHEIECVAFGELRTIDKFPLSTYIVRHESGGKVFHEDAWHRPRAVGALTVWDFDSAGWQDFLLRCFAHIWPDAANPGERAELDPVQVEIAILPTVRAIRAALAREDARGRQAVKGNLRHLPRAYAPPDILPLFDAQQS